MGKSKFIAIAASTALAAMLGLSACGGQAASSSASATASGSASAASSASASSSAASSSSASDLETAKASWAGVLVDGTLVTYLENADGKHASFALTQAGSTENMTWTGEEVVSAGGKVAITDDKTKETVNFTLTTLTQDGVLAIDLEGYAKGALVPMTAADWKAIADAEEYAKSLNTTVNWVGALENATIISFASNDDATKSALSITPAGTNPTTKTWKGDTTATEDGKITITDDDSKQTVSLTITSISEDGTVGVDVEGYGKGTLVRMAVGDYALLDGLQKALQ